MTVKRSAVVCASVSLLAAGGVALGTFAVSGTATAARAGVAERAAVAASTLSPAQIFKQDGRGVVDITVTESARDQGLPFGNGGTAQAEGTGFVYDSKGHIVTADHVVSGASAITVRFLDGKTAKATLVGNDASTDTAVIKVNVPESELRPLAFGNSAALQIGDPVVAIGSPFGYAFSLTTGVVSALGRDIQAPNNYTIPNAIQTDAAINPGNSGGPLIDANGRVIGINVQIATSGGGFGGSEGNAGVGFAVPSNTVKSVVAKLVRGQTVQHPYLGVSVGDAPQGQGAQVGTVQPNSPAAKAALKPGDVITAVDGRPVANANALTVAIARYKVGDQVTLTVKRAGSTLKLKATLATRPASAA